MQVLVGWHGAEARAAWCGIKIASIKGVHDNEKHHYSCIEPKMGAHGTSVSDTKKDRRLFLLCVGVNSVERSSQEKPAHAMSIISHAHTTNSADTET